MIKHRKMVRLKITLHLHHPFKSKANNALVGNTEDLDIFMAMYHLLQYSDNYSMTS